MIHNFYKSTNNKSKNNKNKVSQTVARHLKLDKIIKQLIKLETFTKLRNS